MPEVRQSPKRDWGLVDIGKFRRGIDASSLTPCQVAQERRKSLLGLVQDKIVHLWELLMLHCEERTSCHHLHADCSTAFEDGSNGFALHNHGADENIISPCQVFMCEVCHVEIDQPFFPPRRQHGCNG